MHQQIELESIPRASHSSFVKKAYHRCSLHLHPDKNSSPDATAAFKRVNEAYEKLCVLTAPLPDYWVFMGHHLDSGNTFYYNVATEETSSGKPE
eukprot:scaffold77175_cov53-Phaeocystis_antarctica.AAC.3